MAVELVRARPQHVGPIANRMRGMDVLECRAFGHSPKEALRLGLRASSLCYTAKVDGRPEAMFGLTVTNAMCGEGSPWMLGTEAIYEHPREMIRWGAAIVRRWADSTPYLKNVVAVRNDRAIRMLRRWGFTVSEGGDQVFAGVEFATFTMDRR
ncbi:MAG: hypothetical protein JWN66_4974 [Sphingomonas bacterium]|uniref:hypothetical protein n=1 Tax=Sphingomonas bacterium TaxID=1895847 RepID=UPI002626FE9F|nr:hypothetical protein [Sphingomonas bacterium]MDB5707858.1 hypothetical protein [Sphingomonas bacterium]